MTTALPDPQYVTEPTEAQPEEAEGLVARLRNRLSATRDNRANTAGPARWVMNTGEGTAIAAGSRQLQGLDGDEVFGADFGRALRSVVMTSKNHPELSGAQRLRSAQEAYNELDKNP